MLAADDPAPLELRPGHVPEVDGDGAGVRRAARAPPTGRSRSSSRVSRRASSGEVDVVFPLLHGPFGEDGTLQGSSSSSDIRYVGSGVLRLRGGMDKHYMKVVFAGHGLPVGPVCRHHRPRSGAATRRPRWTPCAALG